MIKGGPKIINDGLVLCLDAHDAKSYAGEPTQNYFINDGWWGDGTNQTIGSKGAVDVTDENLKYNGYPTVLWTPGSATNAYLNGSDDIDTSATSTEWTFSVYAKYEDGTDISSMSVYLYYPSSDGSAAGTITDAGNGWKRISRTRTGSSNYIGLAGITGILSNKKIYLSGWQLEKKQYITPVVGVNSSRSATNGWVDRTGNSTGGTLTNMDGTGTSHYRDGEVIMPVSASYLRFDGSDAEVIFSQNSAINLSANSPYTLEYWVSFNYLPTTSFAATIMKGSFTSSYGHLFIKNTSDANTQILVYTDDDSSPELTVTYLISTTTWYHIVQTFSSGVAKLYINGELEGSASGLTSTSNTSALRLGSHAGAGYFMNGDLAKVNIYNIALTDAQVLSNYNATKERF